MKLRPVFILALAAMLAGCTPVQAQEIDLGRMLREATLVSATSNSATFAVIPPPSTNNLPFYFWTRQSRGITAASIATKTNVLRLHIAASTNAMITNVLAKVVTNAEWNIVFTNWPATQHLHVFMINDGVSEIVPLTNLFYRVTQFR